MKSKYIPILVLVLITPFLTELLCSNVPASLFFQPYIFLILVLSYSLPVLAIRELSIRWNLGILGILVLGIAYGIFNEGICAKTLLWIKDLPIPVFDGYSFLTINFAWSILILIWHALHSVLFPIIIITYLYPKHKKTGWLNNKVLFLVCLLFTATGIVMFFTTPSFQAPPIYLLLFSLIIIFLIFVSKFTPKTPKIETEILSKKTSIYPAILGFCFYLFYFLGLVMLAYKRLPEFILLLYLVLLLVLVYFFLKIKKWLTLPSLLVFAIGDYCGLAFISVISGLEKGSLEIVIAGVVFVILFIISVYLIVRKSSAKI